jgi:hypothetical protein
MFWNRARVYRWLANPSKIDRSGTGTTKGRNRQEWTGMDKNKIIMDR